jgi:hypothetical protein
MGSLREELEHWYAVDYRMDNEGLEYCFKHYSNFDEIQDEEFHKLRQTLLTNMENMRNMVREKIEKLEQILN